MAQASSRKVRDHGSAHFSFFSFFTIFIQIRKKKKKAAETSRVSGVRSCGGGLSSQSLTLVSSNSSSLL
ncbi:hypothetical protein GDO78_021620 [Eleutherodactylus coqui]|uniref:Uncharacterized protein n=1 Tax=Eleutherodactylus coqui TaxID=57060 RepID=A0A8J6E591_ELECQ|nr:hypothetical protein GDO78_021620 [Eleutherodactylus coqui]